MIRELYIAEAEYGNSYPTTIRGTLDECIEALRIAKKMPEGADPICDGSCVKKYSYGGWGDVLTIEPSSGVKVEYVAGWRVEHQ